METVVEENPLSFATSRIVTIDPLPTEAGVDLPPTALVIEADAGGHYSRVQSLSRIGMVQVASVAVAISCFSHCNAYATTFNQSDSATRQGREQHSISSQANEDPAKLFARGEAALANGDLEKAEHAFKKVLAIDPNSAAAYANLGVIDMRRKRWAAALTSLHRAEKLAPQMTGVRLNIGLAYYRKNEYWHAIPAFESVIREQPDSLQARFLLGQCYFFTERWVEAVDTLEPIWPQESNDLTYLYVLGIAAEKADRKNLSDRALARLAEVGGDSAEVHLLIGKAKLNLEAYDDAIGELKAALAANPKLPFGHFYLGMAHSKTGNYELAKSEFLRDIALEPDVVFDYDELGNAFFMLEKDPEAIKAYQQALKLDPKMLDAHLGLAKVFQRQEQYDKALQELAAAGKLDPTSSRIHYLRGQILLKMGHKEEGKKELDTSVAMSSARRDQRQKELEGDRIPNPEQDASEK
jgi:tetratricopeptide (TPR) repeat protein